MTERVSTEEEEAEVAPLTGEEVAARESANALRQYDLMRGLISDATSGARFRLRPSTLLSLNRVAVEGLIATAGAFRRGEVSISNSRHVPPSADTCPEFLDELCDYVNDHWETQTALHLSAYVMWRLNWIHPFGDGNGRTSRAGSFLVLCARLGHMLPGATAIPEMIAEDKTPYYAALDAADDAWRDGQLDVSAMESLLEELLAKMLVNVFESAKQ